MATAKKILGQLTGSSSWQTLYEVPKKNQSAFQTREERVRRAIVANIIVCNLGFQYTAGYSIRVVPDGETAGDQHLLTDDKTLPAVYSGSSWVTGSANSHLVSLDVTLEAGDRVDVKTSGSFPTFVSINAFGAEIF
jgi:hypothetical protein